MTEGNYINAMDCLRKSEQSMHRRNYAYGHIYLMEAMRLLGEEIETELADQPTKDNQHE
jgi:hypothetical protein